MEIICIRRLGAALTAAARPAAAAPTLRAKPRLLDLFCCQGGAAMGYSRAGFDVVGVDIVSQPRYPFEFHQADALEYVAAHGHEFDAIHASPPCQGYSRAGRVHKKVHPMLISKTRAALLAIGRPYIIENVEGAPLLGSLLLCGTMFGLSTRRHRVFETSFGLSFAPFTCQCQNQTINGNLLNYHNTRDRNFFLSKQSDNGATAFKKSLGVEWMTFDGSQEAIPPAYTQFIGAHLLAVLALNMKDRS